jgi:hypothetical protein
MDENAELPPPWIKFPKIPWLSIGWRMGPGESYRVEWHNWFCRLSTSDREHYKSQFPEGKGWTGFYKMTETGESPDFDALVRAYYESRGDAGK